MLEALKRTGEFSDGNRRNERSVLYLYPRFSFSFDIILSSVAGINYPYSNTVSISNEKILCHKSF